VSQRETGLTGVLFVCLGNICRSPLAEGIFLHHAARAGVSGAFDVESAGTGAWHIGERPDRRAQQVARHHGIELPSIARQVDPRSDFARFDWILAMDGSNRHELVKLGAPENRVWLMRSFDPSCEHGVEDMDVPDPYFGGTEGFDTVFEMLWRSCEGLLDRIGRDSLD